MNDYYEILGVKKEATQEEIDVAYRALARKWHPDMHPNDQKQSATEQFKRIAEAYETLGNPDKRSQYDNRGTGWMPQFRSQSDFVNDIFQNFFGEKQAAVRGTRVKLQITLKEAFTGCTKIVEIQQQKPCAACNTSGCSKWTQCSVCGGSGVRSLHQVAFLIRTTCTACNGQGRIPTERCTKCSGQGHIRGEIEKIDIEVPCGVEDGTQIRIPDKGLDGGDLYVVVVVSKDDKYIREGRHLFINLAVNYTQLVLGGESTIETLDGTKVSAKIKAGTQPGIRLRIKGQGMPAMQASHVRGDLFITLFVKVPEKINKEQRELLEKLRDAENK